MYICEAAQYQASGIEHRPDERVSMSEPTSDPTSDPRSNPSSEAIGQAEVERSLAS